MLRPRMTMLFFFLIALTTMDQHVALAFSASSKRMATDMFKKLKWTEEEHTPEEAAVSAAIYMNPATAKISPNVKVTWETQVATNLRMLQKVSNPDRPFMVGIVGIPGSGKSTSSDILASLLGDDAIVMPMDGYHFSLAHLLQMPNAANVIYRRGAPDTFDSALLARDLDRIVYGSDAQVSIPGFDHAAGDPTPDQHTFHRNEHQIVLCEGIYLLHDDDGWQDIEKFFDWTIYIDIDVDICIDRLKERNKCIPGYTPEEIEIRCDEVDRKNCEIAESAARKYANQIVRSGTA